jgi:hypothetical protein
LLLELEKANFLWENEKMAEFYEKHLYSVNHGKLDIGGLNLLK